VHHSEWTELEAHAIYIYRKGGFESNQLPVPYLLNPFQTASASTPHDGRAIVLYRNGHNGFTQNACIAQLQPQYAHGEMHRSTRKPNQPRYDIDILIVAEIGFVYLLVQSRCTYTLRSRADITKNRAKAVDREGYTMSGSTEPNEQII